MIEDYRSKRRFHIFKSVTGKFVFVDHEVSSDWQIYTESLSEFAIKLATIGILDKWNVWFEDDDFTEEEKNIINDSLDVIEKTNLPEEECEKNEETNA